jgi:hypothetical protein
MVGYETRNLFDVSILMTEIQIMDCDGKLWETRGSPIRHNPINQPNATKPYITLPGITIPGLTTPARRIEAVNDIVQPPPMDQMYKDILAEPDDFDYEEQARLDAQWDKELAGLTFKRRVREQKSSPKPIAGFSRAALLRRYQRYRI